MNSNTRHLVCVTLAPQCLSFSPGINFVFLVCVLFPGPSILRPGPLLRLLTIVQS